MLPDFPIIKSELQKRFEVEINIHIHYSDPLLRQISTIRQHEGDTNVYSTINGEKHQLELEKHTSKLVLSKDELQKISLDDFSKKIFVMAEDLKKQFIQMMFKQISEASMIAGTTVSVEGQPLSFEDIYNFIEKVEIEFDEETKQPIAQFISHPSLTEKLKELNKEWGKNPEYQARMKKQMEKKYEEWRNRESDRKLVD